MPGGGVSYRGGGGVFWGLTPRGWSFDCTLDIESPQEELQENPSHTPEEGCTTGTTILDDDCSCGNDRSEARPTSSCLRIHAGRLHTSRAFSFWSSHSFEHGEHTEASLELDCETVPPHSRPGPKPASLLYESRPVHAVDPCPCDILFHVRLGFQRRMSAWIFASFCPISASFFPDVRLGFGRYSGHVRFILPDPTIHITVTGPTDLITPTDLPDLLGPTTLTDGTDLPSYQVGTPYPAPTGCAD